MPPSPAAARAGIVRAVAHRQPAPRAGSSRPRRGWSRCSCTSEGTPAQRRGRPPGSGRAASRALSAAALTSVAGPCRGRLVGAAVTAAGDPVAVANFAGAARAAGPRGPRPPRRPGVADHRRARAHAREEGEGPRLRAPPPGVAGPGAAPGRRPGAVDRRRGRPARGRHQHRLHRLPGRDARRGGRGGHRHAVRPGPGRRPGAAGDVRRHPGRHVRARRRAARPGAAPGRLPVEVAGVERRGC